jgi:hypothetical protein
MKGRDLLIGVAIGLCLVLVSHGQHGQVSAPTIPVVSPSSPSATPSRLASAPATLLPQGSPAAPTPQGSARNLSTGLDPPTSGGTSWLVLMVFSAIIAISFSTCAVTAIQVRAASRRRTS